jgi:hypothetical protein
MGIRCSSDWTSRFEGEPTKKGHLEEKEKDMTTVRTSAVFIGILIGGHRARCH